MQTVRKEVHGGLQFLIRFKNNKGASVLRCPCAKGWPDKWELVTLRFTGRTMDDYDVVPRSMKVVTDQELTNALRRIKGE